MSKKIAELVADIKMPRMVRVKQNFDSSHIEEREIEKVIRRQIAQEPFCSKIKPGMRIAITAGSRGIVNIVTITKAIVDCVRERGGEPFLVPAMGSHGGSTAKGQLEVLHSLGIEEKTVGCPIISSMEVKQIGVNEEGAPVFIDKNAAEADGIIVTGRVKAHTGFSGDYESGIMKMMTIGLGKRQGAEYCHMRGHAHMHRLIPMFGRAIIQQAPILFAVAIIENALKQTCKLVVLEPAQIEREEPKLLREAKNRMARILIDETDVLVVDEIGKNISGPGMDPNVTGTFYTPYASGGLKSQRVTVLDLSKQSKGNAGGMGMASFITRRLFEKIDYTATYLNAITSTLPQVAKIPIIIDNDRDAIRLAIKTCYDIDYNNPKLIRIKNTASLEYIEVSVAHIPDVEKNPMLELVSAPYELAFDGQGNLF
jgi:hypothetical protein